VPRVAVPISKPIQLQTKQQAKAVFSGHFFAESPEPSCAKILQLHIVHSGVWRGALADARAAFYRLRLSLAIALLCVPQAYTTSTVANIYFKLVAFTVAFSHRPTKLSTLPNLLRFLGPAWGQSQILTTTKNTPCWRTTSHGIPQVSMIHRQSTTTPNHQVNHPDTPITNPPMFKQSQSHHRTLKHPPSPPTIIAIARRHPPFTPS
jgi:hypothetical protein